MIPGNLCGTVTSEFSSDFGQTPSAAQAWAGIFSWRAARRTWKWRSSMSNDRIQTVLPYLERLVSHPDEQHSDRELLGRFRVQRDERAFAEILRRHGPL